ncbi:hypothetical protein [Chryseobacterium sp. IT-36CA2]|uniref:hypothetical protein n=1 Tax=Chryseobacterium sp. IT-36CA2 TaxID=3026460 RepID=UPI0039E07428
MKKIFAAVFLSLTCASFAQTVNDVPIKNIDVEYIQIVGIDRLFSNKKTVDIDFGQNSRFLSTKDVRILDEKGETVKFNSMIDALNFMSANGYAFQFAYTSFKKDIEETHYILKKK